MIDQNKNGLILSYLHKAIKPVNQLRMIEDNQQLYTELQDHLKEEYLKLM